MRVFGKFLGRLLLLVIVCIAAFLAFGPGYVESQRNAVTREAPYEVSPEALALHGSLTIGDWHADSLLWNRDLNHRSTIGHVDIPRLLEGNVAVQVFTAVTKSPAGQNYHENTAEARDNITTLAVAQLWPPRTWNSLAERALYQAERLHGFAEESEGALRVVTTAEDLDAVLEARSQGVPVVAGLLGIEGAHALEGDIANLDRLEAAGYRVIGLHHFFDNALGGSLHGVGDAGLSAFGAEVVAEVVARNMVLDLAHSSPQVARDVLAATDIPLIVSHTGLRSACDAHRNFPDDLMRDIVANGADEGGGVIGIGYWADVTCDDSPEGVARVIMAAIDAVGVDHVSLGSDYDGSVAVGFDTSELAALTDALLRAGASEEEIRAVMGENMLRVLRARLN
ncbi:dipeptidase [Gymnodinialimonas ceratoperidinii]|uniref:Membrane dipeptidase n=1 Tax=Gymnodinialimonas ceratoperidinii TaxID=2856823 RepID=A0A8F6YC13_9RHOB|nr:membrane dipeptidase [Gymnodinialimonas ceratoperidinii]QXT40731.1 membrane dipeptidase [Gymnodinialimonas ceratoperidinii]